VNSRVSAKSSLSDACELITDGTHFSPASFDTGEFMYVTSKNVREGRLDLTDVTYVSRDVHNSIFSGCPVRLGDVLYVKDGANTGLAAINTIEQPFSMLSSVALIRPKERELDAKYLMHWLNSPHGRAQMLQNMSGAAIKRLVLTQIRRASIPLPPLDEQRRIAAILDQADDLRRKRKEALERLDGLLKAYFRKIFGNTASNDKGFALAHLGDICDVRDGTHDSPKYVSTGPYLLTSKNFTSGRISYDGAGRISETDFKNINKRSKVDLGDIIMPMIGTIGSPVVVETEPDFAIKNVALIKLKNSQIDRDYLLAILAGPLLERHVSRKGRGGTQKFLSLGDIRSLYIPVPPKPLQEQYALGVKAWKVTENRHRTHHKKLNALFASLQRRAFRGEL
jgi:type I restriction enzyme S subunit